MLHFRVKEVRDLIGNPFNEQYAVPVNNLLTIEREMPATGKSSAPSFCPGPIPRREFLRIGLTGFASLSLPALFQLRAQAAAPKPKSDTAVILVWLRGGLSHLESYDPKPNAPSEVRGAFGTIP